MSQQVLQNQFDLFPLDLLLRQERLDLRHVLEQRQPCVLLSQVPSLEKGLVSQLEQAGIFDTDDFSSAISQLSTHLGMSQELINRLQHEIHLVLEDRGKTPKVILSLPDNFALISVHQGQEYNHLGILWRGLQSVISCSRHEYWHGIKHQLDQLLERMDRPELVGRIAIDHPPQWLEGVVPLSTYIRNIPLTCSLVEIAENWGLLLRDMSPPSRDLLAASYLIELAKTPME